VNTTILKLAKARCEGKICVPVAVYNQLNLRVQTLYQIEGGFLVRYSKSGENCSVGDFSHFLCASVALPTEDTSLGGLCYFLHCLRGSPGAPFRQWSQQSC